jgi:hypothetical protein
MAGCPCVKQALLTSARFLTKKFRFLYNDSPVENPEFPADDVFNYALAKEKEMSIQRDCIVSPLVLIMLVNRTLFAYQGGDGTPASPYQIGSAADLLYLASHPCTTAISC